MFTFTDCSDIVGTTNGPSAIIVNDVYYYSCPDFIAAYSYLCTHSDWGAWTIERCCLSCNNALTR